MTKKRILWLALAIGMIAAIGAALLFHKDIENKTHNGAVFVMRENYQIS